MTRRRVRRASWLIASLMLFGCGKGDVATAPSAETRALRAKEGPAVDTADVIDALVLGSGPLIPRDGATACPNPRVWTGFPRGTTVRVRVSSTVAPDAQVALRRAVAQVASATDGAVAASVELTDAPDLLPGSNEVTVTTHPSPRNEGCPSDRGCVLQVFRGRGLLASGRALESPGQPVQAYVRDVVGRGILGMCQIDGTLIGGAGGSLMSAGRGIQPRSAASALTGLDVTAARAVYASSLDPGATRKEFLQAGLVHLQAGERPRGPPPN